MVHRNIIVIGASAGGIEALQRLVRPLRSDLPAAIFVTVHFPDHGTSVLPRILSRAGSLPAIHAVDGDAIVPGRIYIAPPGYHLLLEPERLRVIRGPKENGNRPAIDPMFRSAAVAFGQRVIGVVLTGLLDDGTAGLAAIKRAGGHAIVQDPQDALFPSMPESAIRHVQVDRVVPIVAMASTLTNALAERVAETADPPPPRDIMEKDLSAGELSAIEQPENHPGRVSSFGCPDCGGVLWEINDGEFVRFRCRVGHGWTSDALLAEQGRVLDDALWTALRALEENAALSRQIAARHRANGAEALARRFDAQATGVEARAAVVRNSLVRGRVEHSDDAPSDENHADETQRRSTA
jgi:two-component system chemotaxis response regulator CheB